MERIQNGKEKEVILDIEAGENNMELDHDHHPVPSSKPEKKSLKKLISGTLGFSRLSIGESSSRHVEEHSDEKIELLVDDSLKQGEGGCKDNDILPLAGKNQNNTNIYENEKRRKGKAPKPPRPPKAPTLDAADMRLVREISMVAMKKRERIQRMKALKKLKASKSSSPSSSSSSKPSSNSSMCAVSAMAITILFFLLMIFQGLGSSSSLETSLAGSPQPALDTKSLPLPGHQHHLIN